MPGHQVPCLRWRPHARRPNSPARIRPGCSPAGERQTCRARMRLVRILPRDWLVVRRVLGRSRPEGAFSPDPVGNLSIAGPSQLRTAGAEYTPWKRRALTRMYPVLCTKQHDRGAGAPLRMLDRGPASAYIRKWVQLGGWVLRVRLGALGRWLGARRRGRQRQAAHGTVQHHRLGRGGSLTARFSERTAPKPRLGPCRFGRRRQSRPGLTCSEWRLVCLYSGTPVEP